MSTELVAVVTVFGWLWREIMLRNHFKMGLVANLISYPLLLLLTAVVVAASDLPAAAYTATAAELLAAADTTTAADLPAAADVSTSADTDTATADAAVSDCSSG